MYNTCIRNVCIFNKIHSLEPVSKDNFLIQILMYKCIKLYMQRRESDPKKTLQTTIKNADHDYQTKFCHKHKKQNKTGPGPAFAGPV